MVDIDKAVGTAAGIIGTGILAGAGLAAISIPIEIVKHIITPDKKSKPVIKKTGEEPEDKGDSMMDRWEKTWME
jgi:hypothetical protein